jgi:hypothetical protein
MSISCELWSTFYFVLNYLYLTIISWKLRNRFFWFNMTVIDFGSGSVAHGQWKLIQTSDLNCQKSFGWRNFPPENSIWNMAVPLLSYSCMFQVEICSQQLEICKSVCMFIVLALLWRLINFRLFCSDDCRSWPCDEKINNHGKYAHIPDNDYWGICLFHVVWTIFFGVQLFLCGTHGIYFYLHPTFFSSTEHEQ